MGLSIGREGGLVQMVLCQYQGCGCHGVVSLLSLQNCCLLQAAAATGINLFPDRATYQCDGTIQKVQEGGASVDGTRLIFGTLSS